MPLKTQKIVIPQLQTPAGDGILPINGRFEDGGITMLKKFLFIL